MMADNSPAFVVSRMLEDLGLVSLPDDSRAWPVYVSLEADAPDNTVTVYDTQGVQHGRRMADGVMSESFGVQIRVRGNYPDGYAKASAISRALDTLSVPYVLTIGGSTYIVYNFSRTSSILSLIKDPSSKRRVFTLNGLVVLEEV